MQKYNFGRCRFCIFIIKYQVCDEGSINKKIQSAILKK